MRISGSFLIFIVLFHLSNARRGGGGGGRGASDQRPRKVQRTETDSSVHSRNMPKVSAPIKYDGPVSKVDRLPGLSDTSVLSSGSSTNKHLAARPRSFSAPEITQSLPARHPLRPRSLSQVVDVAPNDIAIENKLATRLQKDFGGGSAPSLDRVKFDGAQTVYYRSLEGIGAPQATLRRTISSKSGKVEVHDHILAGGKEVPLHSEFKLIGPQQRGQVATSWVPVVDRELLALYHPGSPVINFFASMKGFRTKLTGISSFSDTKKMIDMVKQPGDHASHTVAAQLGGSGDSHNMAAVNGRVNMGPYKKMENSMAKTTKADPQNAVYSKVRFHHDSEGESLGRPSRIDVESDHNNKGVYHRERGFFPNENPAKWDPSFRRDPERSLSQPPAQSDIQMKKNEKGKYHLSLDSLEDSTMKRTRQ